MSVSSKNKFFSRLVASALLLLFTAWILISKDVITDQSQIIQVKAGSSMGAVAQDLSDKKLIKSKLFFTSLSRLLNANKKLKSGYYELEPNTTVLGFIEKISRGEVLKTKVTLIEGKTIKKR